MSAKYNYQALGRLKSGTMNKMEAKYAGYLETLKMAGEILWYKFDCTNLRIGENCFYKTDFLVLKSDQSLQLHEVKGFMTDDALVKLKVVAATFPIPVILVTQEKGSWKFSEV